LNQSFKGERALEAQAFREADVLIAHQWPGSIFESRLEGLFTASNAAEDAGS